MVVLGSEGFESADLGVATVRFRLAGAPPSNKKGRRDCCDPVSGYEPA